MSTVRFPATAAAIRPIWLAALVACTAALTGCIQMDGVHYVNHYGEPDAGGYSFSIDTPIYLALIADKPDTLDDLRGYSRPRVSYSGGRTTISDMSGGASMDKAYTSYNCVASPGLVGWSDCSFSYRNNRMTFPGWSLGWTVVLHREMVLLNSNHDRRTTRNGAQVLQWQFDGDQVNAFDISFKVRVPNA